MAAPALNVVQLYDSNHRDPVATLRRIADEIEAGQYGDVGTAVLVKGLAGERAGRRLCVFQGKQVRAGGTSPGGAARYGIIATGICLAPLLSY